MFLLNASPVQQATSSSVGHGYQSVTRTGSQTTTTSGTEISSRLNSECSRLDTVRNQKNAVEGNNSRRPERQNPLVQVLVQVVQALATAIVALVQLLTNQNQNGCSGNPN